MNKKQRTPIAPEEAENIIRLIQSCEEENIELGMQLLSIFYDKRAARRFIVDNVLMPEFERNFIEYQKQRFSQYTLDYIRVNALNSYLDFYSEPKRYLDRMYKSFVQFGRVVYLINVYNYLYGIFLILGEQYRSHSFNKKFEYLCCLYDYFHQKTKT